MTRRTARWWAAPAAALAAACLVAAAALPGRAGAADATTAPTPPGAPSVALVDQTPYVTGQGTFAADVRVADPDPATDTLYVAVWSRLTSRADFDSAVAGHPRGYQIWYRAPQPLTTLAPSGSGLRVSVPVNGPDPAAFPAHYGSAVYPLTLQLRSRAGTPLGRPLTTFLVYAAAATATAPRLAVSLTVPVDGPVDTGPTATRLPAADSSALAALAGVLHDDATVPVTLAPVPEVLDRLAAGPATDRATLATLAAALGGDEVLAAPYYPAPLGSLATAGLQSEIQAQYRAGTAAEQARLLQAPTTGSAAVPGDLDGSALGALSAEGASHLVVPDGDLSALPEAQRQITFASPTGLAGARGVSAQVVGSDPVLSGLLTGGGHPVLAAEQLLAGLSLVQLEAPSLQRGVALLAPAGDAVDPTVLRTFLAGLQANPLLAAVTVDGLFRAVPAASSGSGGSGGSGGLVRTLADPRSATPFPNPAAVRSARAAVEALAAIAPGQSRAVEPSRRLLLAATSTAVPASARGALLSGVTSAVRRAEAGIALPGSSSITLTARTGTIPLTVLSNPALRARVQLRVVSPKLRFRPFSTPLGTCTVLDSGTETCQLTLTSEATTLRIPVETRTGGVFAMQVSLLSPDGSVVLASNRDTVRSTAFSGVGVVLIVVAALGLVVWWVRNARHGRRARQLVTPPGETAGTPPAGDLGDPVISEFFASPPPEYGGSADPAAGEQVSPSGLRQGPNT